MKSYKLEAERVWGEIDKAIVAGPEGQGDWLPTAVGMAILAAALQAAYRDGVEAMREEVSAAKQLSPEAATEGKFYLGNFLRDYADACANRLKE